MCTAGYDDDPVIKCCNLEWSTIVLRMWLVGQSQVRKVTGEYAFWYPSRITSSALPLAMNLIPAHHEPSQPLDPTVGKAPN